MLSTSFVRQESLELLLPSSSAGPVAGQSVLYIYVSNNGEIFIGNQAVDLSKLNRALSGELDKNPDQSIMVLVADKVSVQTLVTVMDKVYVSGARNISVSDWKMPVQGAS